MRRARAAPLVALGLAGSLAGCASDNTASIAPPNCSQGADGSAANGVVLMAQSVPSATFVPCLRTTLPNGWEFHHLDARNGVARFYLDSDRDGDKAIEVRLEATCDTAGSTEVPSDRLGMRRLERVRMLEPHYEGERYYVFDGACITLVFDLTGDSRGEPLGLASDAVGVVSRADLADQVHAKSDGRLSLDPPPASGGGK